MYAIALAITRVYAARKCKINFLKLFSVVSRVHALKP